MLSTNNHRTIPETIRTNSQTSSQDTQHQQATMDTEMDTEKIKATMQRAMEELPSTDSELERDPEVVETIEVTEREPEVVETIEVTEHTSPDTWWRPRSFPKARKEMVIAVKRHIKKVIPDIELPERQGGERWAVHLAEVLDAITEKYGHLPELAKYFEESDVQYSPQEARANRKDTNQTPKAKRTQSEMSLDALVDQAETPQDTPRKMAKAHNSRVDGAIDRLLEQVNRQADENERSLTKTSSTLVNHNGRDEHRLSELAQSRQHLGTEEETQEVDVFQPTDSELRGDDEQAGIVSQPTASELREDDEQVAGRQQQTLDSQDVTMSKIFETMVSQYSKSEATMQMHMKSIKASIGKDAEKQITFNKEVAREVETLQEHVIETEKDMKKVTCVLAGVVDNQKQMQSEVTMGKQRLFTLATAQQKYNDQFNNRLDNQQKALERSSRTSEQNSEDIKRLHAQLEKQNKASLRGSLDIIGFNDSNGVSVFVSMIRSKPEEVSEAKLSSEVISELLKRIFPDARRAQEWRDKIKSHMRMGIAIRMSLASEGDAVELVKLYNNRRKTSPTTFLNLKLEYAKTEEERNKEAHMRRLRKCLQMAPFNLNVRIRGGKLYAFEDDGKTRIMPLPNPSEDEIAAAATKSYSTEETARMEAFNGKFEAEKVWSSIEETRPKQQQKASGKFWKTTEPGEEGSQFGFGFSFD